MVSIGSVVPSLTIILIVTFSLKYGQFYGTIFAAVTGLVFDLISGGALGTAMFAATISGFVVGYFYSENKIEYNTQTMFLLLLVFIAASVNSFFYLLLTASEIELTASHLILEQGILPGVYSSLLTLPVVLYNQRRKGL